MIPSLPQSPGPFVYVTYTAVPFKCGLLIRDGLRFRHEQDVPGIWFTPFDPSHDKHCRQDSAARFFNN